MIGSRVARVALALGALTLTRCTKPRTELVVTVRSELAWGEGRDLQSLVVTVRRDGPNGAIRWQQSKVLGSDVGQWPLPLSFGLYPSDASDTTPVWIEVLGCAQREGCVAGGAVIVQRAVVSYRPEQTVGLDLWLAARCRGVMCGVSERCVRETGRCELARRADDDVATLPGGVVPTAMDGGVPTVDVGALGDASRDGARSCPSGAADCRPAFAWERHFGSSGGDDIGRGGAADASGNVYIVAHVSGTFDAGGGPFMAGEGACALVAYSSSGGFRWSWHPTTNGEAGSNSACSSVAVDATGNVYVVGSYNGVVDLGAGMIGRPREAGGPFVASLTSTGQYRWAHAIVANGNASGLAVTPSGSVYVVGQFNADRTTGGGPVDWGGGPLMGTPGQNLYVASFGANGAFAWARSYSGGPGGEAIAANDSGIVLTGSHSATLDFGDGHVLTTARSEAFLVGLTATGAFRWSARFATDSAIGVQGSGVALDAVGNVFVAGTFSGSVDFGLGAIESSGRADGYVVSYSPSGGPRWARQYGADLATSVTSAYGVAVDPSGNVVATGTFRGAVNFGGGPLESDGVDAGDIFVVGLTASGDYRWSRQFGATGDDFSFGAAWSRAEAFHLTGVFRRTVDFGDGPTRSAGAGDVFLLKLLP